MDGNMEERSAFREQRNACWAKPPHKEVEGMHDSKPRWMPPSSTL